MIFIKRKNWYWVWSLRNDGRNAWRLNKSQNYCNVEDKSELITKHRVIKSREEIVYVRKAAELADKALDQAWKYTKAGKWSKNFSWECKVVLEEGGDYPANEYIIALDITLFYVDTNLKKEIYQRKTNWVLNGPTYKHYHSAMFRTIPIGKRSKHIKMHEACLEALNNCEKN